MIKKLILAMLILSTNAWGSSFLLRTKETSPEALKLLSEANKALPEAMKEAINTEIEVDFTDLNGKKVESLDQPKLVLGNSVRMLPGQKKGHIQLDRVLLLGINNPQKIKHAHKDTLTYARAILVHEVSHFYDNRVKASSDPTFLNMSGWISKGLIFKKRTNLNTAKERSPDPYEFKNPAETFAVNFEFFISDKNFKCRRPTFYNYYSHLLKMEPFNGNECEMNRKITLVTQSVEKRPRLTREIDPSRIYQIHYLFAGKGKEMMSRWGHAMFRVVLCAPGKEVGPSCMNDLSEHVVISYRANVEDMTMDYRKGVDGGYASQLFLMNMNDVVSEYTKGEFRDVISLPLALNRDQIKMFTDKLFENYWSYKGSYYFITNNCASEALNLLRSAYPNDKKMQKVSMTTPLGLYDFLVKEKIADISVLDDTKKAVKFGYLFQGVTEKLLASLKTFQVNMPFEKFALETKAEARKAIYVRTLDGSSKSRTAILASALRLEDQILMSREQQFAKKMGEALYGKNPSQDLKNTDLDEQIMEIRAEYKKLAAENFITSGYGVPLKHEFKDISEKTIEAIMESIQARSDGLKDLAFSHFSDEVTEIQHTMENRVFILNELTKL